MLLSHGSGDEMAALRRGCRLCGAAGASAVLIWPHQTGTCRGGTVMGESGAKRDRGVGDGQGALARPFDDVGGSFLAIEDDQ